MIFTETELPGAYLIDIEAREDERGFNARLWCAREFAELGLETCVVQANTIFNRRRGTLRGLHYQSPPHAEAKLFRCLRGAIYDVIVDLRPESPTYRRWLGVELDAASRRMLYVPPRFAQGFVTLEDSTEVTYQVSEYYAPDYERGIRYDDPAFCISWPTEAAVISPKDRSWPDFVDRPTAKREAAKRERAR